jgi:tight adherence protein C
MASILALVRGVTPAGWNDALQQQITMAGLGSRWPLERLLAVKVLLGVVLAALAWYFLAPGSTGSLILVVLGSSAIGYFLPDLIVRSRASERQQAIERALPDALDQLTMSVEAGLGFEAAMGRAAQVGEGPLADEFIRVLQEIQIGIPRQEALRNMADRSCVGDLRGFIFAVIQSESYGLPMADVLRVQASELRQKRHQRAEERALKIPVKIVFPLVFCIFPTLFIVLLGPAAMRIWRALS